MKFVPLARLWLIVLIATAASGCGTLAVTIDEPSAQFQETELSDPPAFDRVRLPLQPDATLVVVDGQEGFFLDEQGVIDLEAFVTAARANEVIAATYEERIRSLTRQVNLLIRMGRGVEQQAAIYRSAYIDEARSCRWMLAGSAGLSAASLILLGVAL